MKIFYTIFHIMIIMNTWRENLQLAIRKAIAKHPSLKTHEIEKGLKKSRKYFKKGICPNSDFLKPTAYKLAQHLQSLKKPPSWFVPRRAIEIISKVFDTSVEKYFFERKQHLPSIFVCAPPPSGSISTVKFSDIIL